MSKINMIETRDGWLRLSEEEYEIFKLGEKHGRADAIDECIKTIIDFCGGLPNGMYVNALKQLKEQANDIH